ncbi:MAG: hypothetical protein V1668_02810 [Patescibacteria group bacterium]
MAKQNKLQQINKLIETAHVSLESARRLLRTLVGGDEEVSIDVADKAKEVGKVVATGNEKIIEGVFDGQNMVGPDGKQYSIPANYASKSKLVQGDTLKLTIMADGSFMYKQIGPVERNRLVGLLARDEATDEYRVIVGEKFYKVLLASITYFKGESGDEVVILTPKDKESVWAAVENIIKIPADGTVPVTAPEAEADKKPAQPIEDIEELSS